MIQREDFPTDKIRERLAQGWLSLEGTPWGFQGRTPGVSLDCAGVLIAGAALTPEVYWDDSAVKFYNIWSWVGPPFYRKFRGIMDEIDPATVTVGDVLMFWVLRSGIAQHCGGIVDNEFMIHAPFVNTGMAGKRIPAVVQRTRWRSPYWQERIYCAFRARPASDPVPRHEVEAKAIEEPPRSKHVVRRTR